MDRFCVIRCSMDGNYSPNLQLPTNYMPVNHKFQCQQAPTMHSGSGVVTSFFQKSFFKRIFKFFPLENEECKFFVFLFLYLIVI